MMLIENGIVIDPANGIKKTGIYLDKKRENCKGDR